MKSALLLSLLVASEVVAAEGAPISLTASDGTGLKLVKLQARGVVADPLAFTELTLTFENPLPRVLEGQFKVTLPEGATVSRFAMKLDGRWQEGEVVEKQAARRAYEDFLHRRQDPALLEQSGGNEFTARVFPIAANGRKEVVLSYSHELVQAGAPFVLPLRGLPELGELDVAVSGLEGEGALKRSRFVPNADFVATPKRTQGGARAGDLVVARVVPVEASAADPLTDVTVLVDSSASRALGWQEQTAFVQALLAGLAKARVRLVAFDQTAAPLYDGPASEFSATLAQQLRARRALGASNVELALQQVLAKPTSRVVLISDGVFTAGVTEGLDLTALLLKLKAAGVARLDAVALGGLRDTASLTRLTTGSLSRDGAVIDGGLGAAEVLRRLGLATRSKLEVAVEGATEVCPQVVSGVQAGDAVLVYARLAPGKPVKVTLGERAISVPDAQLTSVERPLLQRAWTKARIDLLAAALDQADGAPARAKLKSEIVLLSTTGRVLSPFTALLVLETEADYARFNLDRRALADILTVESGRLSTVKRSFDVAVAERPKEQPPRKSAPVDQSEKKREAKVGQTEPPAPKPAERSAARDDARPEAEASKEVASSGEPEAEKASGSSDGKLEEAPASEPSVRRLDQMATARPAASPPPPPPARRPQAEPSPGAMWAEGRAAPMPKGAEPWTGKFRDVMLLLKKDPKKAVALATGWHEEAPGDLLALVAMGEALEAAGDEATAARAYGSIIDLFPSRADLRRFAGTRLERLKLGFTLATDTFARAVEQRPDHPASHRLLAFALLRAGFPERAFGAISAGVKRSYPSGRFAGVERILREDAGLIAAAWIRAEPARKGEILGKLEAVGGQVEDQPSLRFVLNWETDANDVDFHITDALGGHAFYSQPRLASGGELYADVTTGYGPECFTVRAPKGKRAGPYRLQAHYYAIGPMGAGMGKLEIIDHDGSGGLRFEQRPYVVMVNQAYVDLGEVR